MAKGYWVAHMDIDDPQTYLEYQKANAAPFKEYGAKFVVRGGTQQVPEGSTRSRTVVIEFPSYEAALACYESDSYQAAKAIRAKISSGELAIVEGYDG